MLLGCAGNAPKTNFDYADDAIKRKDYAAAYRLIELSLVSQDMEVNKRAVNLVETYPQIRNAAASTFSIDSLNKTKYINKETARRIEKERLSIYQRAIATPAQYAEAEQNYKLVFDTTQAAPHNNNKILLQAKFPDPEYIEIARNLPVHVRNINKTDLLSAEDQQSGISGNIIGTAALLFPPVTAQFIGHTIGEGIIGIGHLLSGGHNNDSIDPSTRRLFIDMISNELNIIHKLPATQTDSLSGTATTIELIINVFDVTYESCLYVNASLFITINNKRIYADHLVIEPSLISDDAPSLECIDPECPKNNDRCLIRAAQHYAHALAVMTAHRLKWKQ